MPGPIERLWGQIPRHQLVPLAILFLGVTGMADPTHRPTGYGGVLQVPVAPAALRAVHPDPLLELQHRELRASRGRILYAQGHALAGTGLSAKLAPKQTCMAPRAGTSRSSRVGPRLSPTF